MLGSFPPPRKRWCMDFYYPNFINDMWRIVGYIFFNDSQYFVDAQQKCFRKEAIVAFLEHKGIALYDMATVVKRLQANASDKYLEIVEATDVRALLSQLPRCKAVASTGEKSVSALCEMLGAPIVPRVGESIEVELEDRSVSVFRMPSSSRAYPMKLEHKAAVYANMFAQLELL